MKTEHFRLSDVYVYFNVQNKFLIWELYETMAYYLGATYESGKKT